ncbi:MAG: DUF1848 domain-containing protein [Sumerlaeia bacterium]
MIISASYKTDIPAFYGDWFINRVRAGYCLVRNPHNSSQIARVDLRPQAVGGVVFWTKNFGPFMRHLDELDVNHIPFIIQYTINSYPRTLERSVVNAQQSISHARYLVNRYSQDVFVWRYDTVVVSSATPYEFHVRNFVDLAEQLAGLTDEVVISFAQFYKKTLRNMEAASSKYGFTWEDPDWETKQRLIEHFRMVAHENGMRLSICSQPNLLMPGVNEARCIDAQRLMRVAGKEFKAKTKGNRDGCMCAESKDIGDYDTCPHGCVYCYAVKNSALAKKRYKAHDPEGEFLFTTSDNPPAPSSQQEGNEQPDLFEQ